MPTNLLFFDTQYDHKTDAPIFGYFLFDPSFRLLSSGETGDGEEVVSLLSQSLPICYDLSYNEVDLAYFEEKAGAVIEEDKAFVSLLDFYRYKRHLHFYVDVLEVLTRLGRIEGEDNVDLSKAHAKDIARYTRILYEELSSRYAKGKEGLFALSCASITIGKLRHIKEGLSRRDTLIEGQKEKMKEKTKFVFFDIECANTDFAEGKICEFSYVVYDANWKRMESREILINPGQGEENDFKLLGRTDSTDLHLKYEANDYAAYRNSPEFLEFALEIKNLLLDEEVALLGYEVESDLRFLAYTFSRYQVDIGTLFALDVKRVYEQVLGRSVRGLGDLVERFVPKEEAKNLQFHAALDDATATGLVLRYFLLLKGMSFRQLLDCVNEDVICELSTSFYPDPDLIDPETYERLMKDKLI